MTTYSGWYPIIWSHSVTVVTDTFYYPKRDVFALNTGKYRPGCFFCIKWRPSTMDNECE